MSSWSAPASISDADLRRLGERMYCDFTSAPRRAYLDCWYDCDVQAAPGSGKTTLLVTKLVHLAERWPFVNQGVCVLSHTNVARHEVEKGIARFSQAKRLLEYPNFVGTLTTFFHTFLALPFLRGLGWQIASIDNETFAARALDRAYRKSTLRNMLRSQNKQQVQSWVANLTLAEDFELPSGRPLTRLKVAAQRRQPNATTSSGAELEEIKAELTTLGVYRYADMLVLARRALEIAPALALRLAARFPLVILDEAQDTSAIHLELVHRLFGQGRSVLQRIGDCNQAIFDGDEAGSASWSPADGYIDLGESFRFGGRIADLASRVTCQRYQTIEGKGPTEAWAPYVMLVARGNEKLIGRRFADLVAMRFADFIPPEVWAVGWTHTASDSESAVRLGTYFPSYEPPQRAGRSGKTILGALQEELAKVGAGDHFDLADVVNAFARHVRSLLAANVALHELPSALRVWRWLDEKRPGAGREARAVLLDLIRSNVRPSASEWTALAGRLRDALAPALPRLVSFPAVDAQLAYVAAPAAAIAATTDDARSETHDIAGRRVRVRIGTIASVKGRTHDATLVVETTRGNIKDICSALEVVTGKVTRDRLKAKPQVRKAVMNVFVAATRPRHLLCLALAKDARSEELCAKLHAQGIIIVEVP